MTESDTKRRAFFEFLFGKEKGYLCIATRNVKSGMWHETFFSFPDEIPGSLDLIHRAATTHDVYYCATLLTSPSRVKENVAVSTCLWADVDEADPDVLLVPPTILIETSEKRTQALWKLKGAVNAEDAEEINQRIAYYHVGAGVDQSGWDLTQLLRVPLTYNHKYRDLRGAQTVTVIKARPDEIHTLEDFNMYPTVESYDKVKIPFPETLPLETATDILDRYRVHLNPRALELFAVEPIHDWSRALWEMELSFFEGGLSLEEVFVVAKEAACNKYTRDKKPDSFLWKEVVRAYQFFENRNSAAPVTELHRLDFESPLLTDEERKQVSERRDITQEYIEWARSLGDAAWQYHQAGAFIVLSTLLTGAVRLPTSFGTILPNLWFMILADTTLTRKSTAMDMAMDLLLEVDPDCVLATDGSIEGLLTSLSMRPRRPSVFLRDEFTGLMEMLTKRDYYAGMLETLTKLYDGKFQKRVLRREVIEVRDPILILFAGGIKEKMYELLNYQHIASGFIPRFVFISADADITKLRPLGPPTDVATDKRDALVEKLTTIHKHYWSQEPVRADAGKVSLPKSWNAKLTDDAWVRYNGLENRMLQGSIGSPLHEVLTPSFDRLAKSGLKAAVLLAATKKLDDHITVEEEDIVRAFYYVEQWRTHTVHLINNVGRGVQERLLERVLNTVISNPGIMRSEVMTAYRMSARDADQVFGTLEQRNLISRAKVGKSERLSPVRL